MLSPQWLDELRARVTLSSVVQRTVKLQRAGHEWKACCPFHNEKSPSFYVNDQKGFYHCFGCQAHGDVIRWMTDHMGLAFMDAVKELAAQAGMEVPAPDPRAAQRAEQRTTLIDVTDAAQGWFVDRLRSTDGSAARDYLGSRGFSDATVREFGFGYAPADGQALKGAPSQFPDELLIEAGMRIKVEDKEPYDRFRDRLMLPIHDARGRVIAFGGRILSKDTDAPKYLNSPDTPLFDKGRTLYNLHRAGPASRKTNRIVVVEGYMDVIALVNAGIADAVAPLGTALTEQQIELLWRLVEVPVLCFAGDAAGQRAAMKAIVRALPMLRPAHSLGIVRLPAGLDPDDLVKQQGPTAMQALLAEAGTLLDTLWAFERDAQPLRTPEDKAGLKQRLLDHVDAIQHPDIRALYKRELMDRFSAFAFPPREGSEWKPRGSGMPGRPASSPDGGAALRKVMNARGQDQLAAAVMAGLTRFPDVALSHVDTLARFAQADPHHAGAIDALLDHAEGMNVAGGLDSPAQLPISSGTGSGAPPDNTRFVFLKDTTDPATARAILTEAIALLVERPALEAAMEAATARFATDPEGALVEQQRLRERKLAFQRRLGQMASRGAADAARSDS